MDWLSTAIAQRRTFVIGEVAAAFDGDEAILAGPSRPQAEALLLPPDPEALRIFLRSADDGHYRPLASARGLRSGWTVRLPARDLPHYLDAIYPLAAAHIGMDAAGALRVIPLDDVLARQSGRYAVVADATPAQRTAVVQALCSQCVRVPVWFGGAATGSVIPCAEACSVLVALCREVVLEPTGAGSADVRQDSRPRSTFAAFENPANQLVAAVRRLLRPKP